MTYINCKEIGYNTKTCKNPRAPDPFRVPTENKRGMPKKNAIETNRETQGASTSTPQQETVSRRSGRLRERKKNMLVHLKDLIASPRGAYLGGVILNEFSTMNAREAITIGREMEGFRNATNVLNMIK